MQLKKYNFLKISTLAAKKKWKFKGNSPFNINKIPIIVPIVLEFPPKNKKEH